MRNELQDEIRGSIGENISENAELQTQKQKRKGRFGVFIFFLLLLIIAVGAAVYFGEPELTVMDRSGFVPEKSYQTPNLQQAAMQIYENTYIVRPHVNENYEVEQGKYDIFLRTDIESNNESARVYMQGAALHEYTLACMRRGSVFSNKSAGKMVALTFDDGPFAAKTPEIVQILQKYNARATFFMLGRYVKNHPELPQQVLAAGSEVGSHSWFHSKQTSLTSDERTNDFALTAKAFEDAIGYAPYLFRAPYGAVSDDVKQEISDQNMILVLWSLDTEDWRAKSADQVYNSVMNVVKDGDIILMHENGDYTLEALPRILAALQEQGYEVVTVSELVYAGSDAQAAAGN
jgi:peptidoglycan/xylan/chitin deacetylase (PgdA/CDA1 family)